MNNPSQQKPRGPRSVLRAPDAKAAIALFLCAAAIGMVYMATWEGTSLFYQNLFGPAAMMAAGRGYVNPDLSQTPELNQFLDLIDEIRAERSPDIDTFDEGTLPDTVSAIPLHPIQQRELYLIGAVGLIWSVFGIAWSALTPLFGLFYGATCTAAYGLFRLGMRRPFAILCTLMLMTSPIHLEYLPALRDYSKAPFILAAIFLTGLIAKHTLSRRALIAAAAACGAAIGIGLGFRIDVLICIPPFLLVLFFFTPGSLRANALPRSLAAACFLAAFLITSWPILTTLGQGGNKCHPALLGFMAPYSNRLGVGGTVYELGHHFLDIEPLALLHAYAQHAEPGSPNFIYETPEYEHFADPYTLQFVMTFPADVAIRAYAAVLRILDELHAGPHHFLPPGIANQFLVKLFRLRLLIEGITLTHVRYATALVLCIIAARNLRLAFTALALILYYAGYSAVQYGTRNFFHLETIPLWVMGVFWCALIMTAIRACRPFEWRSAAHYLNETRLYRAPEARRVALFLALSALLIWPPVYALRACQAGKVHALIQQCLDAERLPVQWTATPIKEGRVLLHGANNAGLAQPPWQPGQAFFNSEILVAEFAPGPEPLTAAIRYASDCPQTDLSWAYTIPPAESGAAPTRLIFPAYYANWTNYTPQWKFAESVPQWLYYRGLELDQQSLGRMTALYTVKDPHALPITVFALLPSDWEQRPPYQTLQR